MKRYATCPKCGSRACVEYGSILQEHHDRSGNYCLGPRPVGGRAPAQQITPNGELCVAAKQGDVVESGPGMGATAP